MVGTATNPFRAALARDRELGRIPDPGVTDWRYIHRTRHAADHPLVFEYNGPDDLVHWIADKFDRLDRGDFAPARTRAFWEARPSYLPHGDDLRRRSAAPHERILARLGDGAHDPGLHAPQDVYNVQDFHYRTTLASGVRTVVDYGAGYGRQSFLFATVARRRPVRRGRTDGSVDLVLFVWSLYEMSGTAADAAVSACARLVRPGGYVYIRDVPHSASYRFDPERRLRAAGFELLYASKTIAGDELHGDQHLYRRTRSKGAPPLRSLLRPRVRRLRATWGAFTEARRQRAVRRG